MNKKLLFILPLFAAGALAAQSPIPNGNFEHWDSVITQNPAYYQCSNNGRGNQPSNAPANVTQAAPWHGKYGVQLATTVFMGDTGFAYIANSNNNPLSGQGGVPYAQKAAGFRIYYKCNVMAKDTAAMLIVFKKAGSVIGTYYYPILGTVGSYTLFAKTFSPALSVTPDSVIFAATSSDVLFGGNGKAGSTLTIDSLTFTGVTSQPTMINGDFENWMADSSYNPTSWYVSTTGQPRTADKLSGKYALELTTGIPPGNGGQIQQGYATDGMNIQVSSHNDSTIGGYPYAHQADSIIFYYKYSAGYVGDSGVIQLQFNKNSKVLFYWGMLLAPTATYKRVAQYFDIGSVPDSVLTSMESSYYYPITAPGSVLKVDSVQFYSEIVAGIAPVAESGSIKVYPNPTGSLVYVDMHGFSGKVDMIAIYDMSGKLIESKNYNFSPLTNTVVSFNLSNYSAGTYLIGISTPSGVQFQKLSKVQ